MRKILIALALAFLLGKANSQGIYQPVNPTAYGTNNLRGIFRTALLIPSGCGVPLPMTNYSVDSSRIALYGDTCNNKLYYYNPRTRQWLLSGGTSIPWDSVSGKPANFPTTYALSNDIQDSIQNRVPYENATRNLILGNYRMSARTVLNDSILARTSAGGKLLSNSGSVVAEWGVGGGDNIDFHGFAGMNYNRSGSMTSLSFTPKVYVDSLNALTVGTVTSVSAGIGMSFTTITSTGAVNADTTVLATRVYAAGLDVGKANTSLNNVNGVLSSTYGGAGSVSGIMKANGTGTVSAAVAGTDYVVPSALNAYLPLSAGSGNVITGTLYINSSLLNSNSTYLDIYNNTTDGSDTKITRIGGGGDVTNNRGANIDLRGNEASGAGNLYLNAGGSGTIIANAAINGTSAAFSGDISASNATIQSNGVDGSNGAVFRLNTTSLNANARNWAIINTWDNFGDLTFRVSSAQGGNALTAGNTAMVLHKSRNISIQSSVDNGTDALQVAGSGLFTGNITTNLPVAGGSGKLLLQSDGTRFGALGTAAWAFGSGGTDFTMLAESGNGIRLAVNGSTQALTIASTGAATFSSDGTFGSGVGSSVITNFTVNGGSSGYPNLRFTTGGSLQSQIQSFGGAMYLQTNGSTTALTLASNQAATFSSSVTSNGFIVNNSSAASIALNNTTSGVQWTTSSNNSGLYVINNGIGGGISIGASSNISAGSMILTSTMAAKGYIFNYAAKSSNYTLTDNDDYITVTNASTITLPTAVGRSGKRYVIRSTAGSGVASSLATTSFQTIDGIIGPFSFGWGNYNIIIVFSDGSNWLSETFITGG